MILKRRKKYLIFPTLIVTIICVIGAMTLPRKYESSTTILVQRGDILNPLVDYAMAIALVEGDRLSTFNEIIYSRTTLQSLADSVGLGEEVKSESERQALLQAIRQNIDTDRPRGAESFSITYTDTDPLRAQKAASTLSNIFIETSIQVENQRNDIAVKFFEEKLEEYRRKFESSQREVVSVIQQRISDLPTESRAMYAQVEGYDLQIRQSDLRIQFLRDELVILRSFPEAMRTEAGKQALFDLQRQELPFVTELSVLLTRFDDLARRFTGKYPEVDKVERQIFDLLDRMKKAVEIEIPKLENQRWEVEKKKAQIVDDLKKVTVEQKTDQDRESNYGIYRNLYDEMKVKLEQARTNRDLGTGKSSRFIVIDPALVPTLPAKPNRALIVAGGFILGLFLGILSVFVVEIIDTTVRTPRDIEIYKKPVIAYIPDGRNGSH